MHVNNLQRSVNDMEELVAIHDEAIGIADVAGALPIEVDGGRIVFEDVTFHYGGHRAPLYRRPVGRHPRRRTGRAGRPLRLRQDHVRQAGAAAVRCQRRTHPDRRSGYRRGDAAIAAQPDRDRAAGSDPVSPLAGREHRLWPARRQHGRDRAGGAACQRARVHPAAAEGLRHAGRRARRQAVRRRAAARRAGARVSRRRAGADPGRGDLEPRFGIGGADPAGDGAADEGTHLDRDRAPAVDGAQPRPHPGVRPRRDRRAGHPCRARQPRRRNLSRAVRAAGHRSSIASRRPSKVVIPGSMPCIALE